MKQRIIVFVLAGSVVGSSVACRPGDDDVEPRAEVEWQGITYGELPEYFKLEEYKEALIRDRPLQMASPEITSASYDIQCKFPPDQLLSTIQRRFAELGWVEIEESLREPEQAVGKKGGWQESPGSWYTYMWEGWWIKGERALNVHLLFESNDPDRGNPGRVIIWHYEGPQTVELIGLYYERQDAARASEAATDQKSDSE